MSGGQESVLRARLTLERPFGPTVRSEVGPVNLRFTIPMHSASRIQLKYLQVRGWLGGWVGERGGAWGAVGAGRGKGAWGPQRAGAAGADLHEATLMMRSRRWTERLPLCVCAVCERADPQAGQGLQPLPVGALRHLVHLVHVPHVMTAALAAGRGGWHCCGLTVAGAGRGTPAFPCCFSLQLRT